MSESAEEPKPGAPREMTAMDEVEVGTDVASHLIHALTLHAEFPVGNFEASRELDAIVAER